MGHKKLVLTNPSDTYPKYLKEALKSLVLDEESKKPEIFYLRDNDDEQALKILLEDGKISGIVDNYAEQYAELLLSKNAHLYQANFDVQVASIKKLLKEHYHKNEPWQLGSWVYYPWSGKLVHILSKIDFEELRSIRNRDLITKKEQVKLFDFEVACFGMSVGSASAQALVLSGISRRIKLIDGAVISGSNLNRILTGVTSVGKNKATAIGQQLYEMNPYIEVQYCGKATLSTINEVFDKPWPIKLAIDEIDDIEMKIYIRKEAKKRKIPVLMATELNDTVMLDVERYDLEPNREIFHNIVPGIEDLLSKKIESQREWMKNAVKIIGPRNMPIKMQESLLKIGSTIVTHPQLGSTVMMTGGAIAFAAKSICTGSDLRSGRYIISLENEMLYGHKKRAHRRHHRKHTQIIMDAMDSM